METIALPQGCGLHRLHD